MFCANMNDLKVEPTVSKGNDDSSSPRQNYFHSGRSTEKFLSKVSSIIANNHDITQTSKNEVKVVTIHNTLLLTQV